MESKIVFFLLGFFNLEFFLFVIFVLAYPFLKVPVGVVDLSKIPQAAIVSVFATSVLLLVQNWKSCFKVFTVFGSSNVIVKQLRGVKKMVFLLWGNLCFQASLVLFSTFCLLRFYSGEVLFGVYFISCVLVNILYSYITIKIGLGKYHEILSQQKIEVGTLTE